MSFLCKRRGGHFLSKNFPSVYFSGKMEDHFQNKARGEGSTPVWKKDQTIIITVMNTYLVIILIIDNERFGN